MIDKIDDSMGKVTIRGVLKGAWEFIHFLLLKPSWGSNRRVAQQAYESRLDDVMKCSESEQ